jgi:hypothetical protein
MTCIFKVSQKKLEASEHEILNLQRTIDSLRHDLIETDIELDTVQRLQRHKDSSIKHTSDPASLGRIDTLSVNRETRVIDAVKTALESASSKSVHAVANTNDGRRSVRAFSNNFQASHSRAKLENSVSSVSIPASVSSDKDFNAVRGIMRPRPRDESNTYLQSTPPRDKRMAISSTPPSMKIQDSKKIQNDDAKHVTKISTSQHQLLKSRADSATISSGFLRSSNLQARSPFTQTVDSQPPVETIDSDVQYRRRVKATIRKNT